LRLARRVAQRQGLQAGSDFEAVRLLRLKGIDPFQRSRLMEMVRPAEAEAAPEAAAPGQSLLPVDENRLPVHARGPGLLAQAGEAAVFADLAEIQRDLARRRRQRQRALALRLFLFIFLPTFIAGYYYARVATPLYATFAEFKIDAPDNPLAGAPVRFYAAPGWPRRKTPSRCRAICNRVRLCSGWTPRKAFAPISPIRRWTRFCACPKGRAPKSFTPFTARQ
jgi:hypothetical protein